MGPGPRLLLSCLTVTALLLLPPLPSLASQVTIERIIVLPDHSSSSSDTSPLLGPNGEDAGRSGISIDGEQKNLSPDIAPDGLPNDEAMTPGDAANTPPPAILHDLSALPAPVRRMHDALMQAAVSGDIEAMRLPIEMNEVSPIIGLDGGSADPLDALRAMSGDADGIEILAIMSELLEMGFVRVGEGTPQDMYVWPYFAHYPFSALTKPQRVTLFRLITAGDYEDMDAIGHYSFFRLGIAPDGTWHYFIAGE